ncbi:MAG: flagellar basal body rod protein FlgF [Burkholderiales bacterium]
MDRVIYVAMAGASGALAHHAAAANNLANAASTGYRAAINAAQSVPVAGGATRAYAVNATLGSDFSPGSIQSTERDLDVALQGAGWLVVQTPDGREAYTRNGNLHLNENGLLETGNGYALVGETGPISIPPDQGITIARDGTVSTVPGQGESPSAVNAVGRIKLVNPPQQTLVRGDDGLFRTRDGAPAQADPKVVLVSGALEGSNVNAVEALMNIIELSRQIELSFQLISKADENAAQAERLLAPRA